MPDPCCCAAGGVATAYFANGQVASNLPVTPAANAALLNEASYMFGVHVVRTPPHCHSLPMGICMTLLNCCARSSTYAPCMRGSRLNVRLQCTLLFIWQLQHHAGKHMRFAAGACDLWP